MIDITIPQLSENITSGTVVTVSVKPGDTITQGQTLLELETEKALLEVPSEVCGTITEVLIHPGDVVTVGQLVFRAFSDISSTPKTQASTPALGSKIIEAAVEPAHDPTAASPSVRRLAREAVSSAWGEISVEPMSMVRKTIASRISESWSAIPHVTQFAKADLTELEKWRLKLIKEDKKPGLLPFIIKIIASALKQYPRFNASIDMIGQKIIYKKYINIGIAVATDYGLIVPVLRQVDEKNITELAAEIKTLAELARDRKLTPDQLEGGTFTITNLGSITSGAFTPIIRSPEVAILGLSRAAIEPQYKEDGSRPIPKLLLPLSLSYDHRVIDGADAARFLEWISAAIKQPAIFTEK